MNFRLPPTAAFAAALLLSTGLRAASSAVAVISPTAGSHVSGSVVFTAAGDGVTVVAQLSGLPPGKHGFHIHEFGDIRDGEKAMATGGHFDPEMTHHHALVENGGASGGHHAGDMGNIEADASGNAHLEVTLSGVSLEGKNSIVGHAVIVHSKADDGGQPTGNAGGRLGQGVIGWAK